MHVSPTARGSGVHCFTFVFDEDEDSALVHLVDTGVGEPDSARAISSPLILPSVRQPLRSRQIRSDRSVETLDLPAEIDPHCVSARA